MSDKLEAELEAERAADEEYDYPTLMKWLRKGFNQRMKATREMEGECTAVAVPAEFLADPDKFVTEGEDYDPIEEDPAGVVPRIRGGGGKWKAGAGVIKQIYKYQKSVDLLCSRAAFNRLVRECGQEEFERRGRGTEVLRWQELAIICVQTAAEQFVMEVMQDAHLVSLVARRCALMPRDMRAARSMRRDKENDRVTGSNREIDKLIFPEPRSRTSKKTRPSQPDP